MPPVARFNDRSSHGGTIISASGDVNANSLGVARDGDLHSCPQRGHGVTPLISTRNQRANSRSIVCIGDTARCGAIVISGSPDVNA